MELIEKDSNLIFYENNDKCVVFNEITGLHYIVNHGMKTILTRPSQYINGDELGELFPFLKKHRLIHSAWTMETIEDLYPKINPYCVWNKNFVVFPYSNAYRIMECNEQEFHLFSKCSGNLTASEIAESMGIKKTFVDQMPRTDP